jgi:hypothetical protein
MIITNMQELGIVYGIRTNLTFTNINDLTFYGNYEQHKSRNYLSNVYVKNMHAVN